jgi:hypothetical protein
MKFLKYINEKAQDEEVSPQDEFNYVSSTIRQMAKSQGFNNINIYLDKDELFIMEIVIKQKETFGSVIKLLDFIAKIQKDILVGYKCDMDLWETKKKEPIFTFEFYQSSSSTPTYAYDDNFPF